MRVLCFDAKVIVYLESNSSMTPEEITEQVETELCMGADIPQATGVVDYAIQNVTVIFVGEKTPITDEEDIK